MRMGPLSALTLATTAALGGLAARGLAQPAPVEGIRPAPVRTHAIVGATVVTSPGHILEDATIVIRDGVIEAVGPDVVGPPQARIWPADDLTVYPGLIDMALLVEVRDLPDASADAGAHWNKRVHPQVAMSSRPGPDRSLREALRKIGFTAAAVYPAKGIFRGSGTVIALADEDEHVLVYRPQADMAIGLNDRAPRGDRSYPNSLMGVMALVRQTLHAPGGTRSANRCGDLTRRGRSPRSTPMPWGRWRTWSPAAIVFSSTSPTSSRRCGWRGSPRSSSSRRCCWAAATNSATWTRSRPRGWPSSCR
ncbi:MAG: amidohydrolase family protein [Planctomycetota bacterium]